jgi:hypothetical protein
MKAKNQLSHEDQTGSMFKGDSTDTSIMRIDQWEKMPTLFFGGGIWFLLHVLMSAK